MEQLVLLLVIAAISLVNWLIERSGKLREQRRLQKESGKQPTPLPETSPRAEIEDHMRRMLESFGFPAEEPRPLPAPNLQVLHDEAPPPLPIPAARVEQPKPRRSKAIASVSRERHPCLKRLDSPEGLREAVVLREILGPPKSLCEP